MTRHRARLLPHTGSRPLHQAHAPSSRRDHPRLITARSLTTSSTSPPFRPGPGRPGLHNHVPTPDPAGRTRTGPGSSRPGLLPLRPRALGLRGPGLHKPSRDHLPTRKAIVDWLVRATSRRRPIMDSGPGGRLPRARLLPHPLLLQRSASTESTGLGGEGLPQTTPLLSAWGRKWGPTPQGSMNTSSQRSLMHCSRKPYETHPRGEVPPGRSARAAKRTF